MRVIFQNSDDQQQFVRDRLLQSDVSLIVKGTGVCLDEYQPLAEPKDKPPVVLLPARLLYDKGIREFVEAAEILHAKMDVRMVLIGKIDHGNPSSISNEQITAWVNQGYIEYWGFENDIKSAYSRCHLVCLPSYREGTPRALIEASACARAVVTTDVPGCRDVIISGENGLLVAAKNSMELSVAIEKLLSDTLLRQRMARRGRQIIEAGFSDHFINKKTLGVYSQLI